MADLADVETALVALLDANFAPGAVFWQGCGGGARCFRGKPRQMTVAADRKANISDLGVTALPGRHENVTRWLGARVEIVPAPGIAVSVVGNSASFSGVAKPGDLIGLVVDGLGFGVAAKGGESAALIAAEIAQAIRGVLPVWLSGSTVTLSAGAVVTGRSVGGGHTLQELSRQAQEMEITLWCPSAKARDGLAAGVCGVLGAAPFLPLADGSGARLRYSGTGEDDADDPASVFVRRLNYSVEYSTYATLTAGTMLFAGLGYDGVDTIR